MYESFFQLQRRPFSVTPDPGCAYQSGSIQTLLDELVVCLERGEGIAVLSAAAGLGKTLICEKVKQELGSGFVTILLRHAHFTNRIDVLKSLLSELGRVSSATTEHDCRLQLMYTLADLRKKGLLLVVICDEAHELSEALLEELRQLVDHADHGVAWVRLLLSGQMELEEKLTSSELSALNQRLRSHVTLSPLTAAESRDYIDYRITWAGGRTEEIFLPETMTEIVAAADGNPRCINQLCDQVLLLAYVAEQKPARPELVREALSDLQNLPLSWNIRAIREPASVNDETSDASVTFGNHLQTWESTPTFSAVESSNSSTGSIGAVWEFGAEAGEQHFADAQPASSASEESEETVDTFERFLRTVETEIERLEAESSHSQSIPPQSVNPAVESGEIQDGSLQEEPVMDRYAAIDAGWPDADLPPVERPRTYSWSEPSPVIPTTKTSHTSVPVMASFEPEQQIHADVVELVSTVQEGPSTRRIDSPEVAQRTQRPASPMEAVETQAPRISPERPFRNLFTRLRRKQKGLD